MDKKGNLFVTSCVLAFCIIGLGYLLLWTTEAYKKTEAKQEGEYQQQKKTCEELYEIKTIPIYSFDLTSQGEGAFSGSFIYSSGTYKEELHYLFYEVLEDGGKIIKKIPVEKSVIYNDEEVSPHIEKIKTCEWVTTGWLHGGSSKEAYKIHIPYNSLKSEYTGDLSKVSGK